MAEQSVGPGRDEQDAEPVVTPEAVAAVAAGRHRRHRFPARGHVVKVPYGEEERAAVEVAAELAGLRPSGYVAAAALVISASAVGGHVIMPKRPSDLRERLIRA